MIENKGCNTWKDHNGSWLVSCNNAIENVEEFAHMGTMDSLLAWDNAHKINSAMATVVGFNQLWKLDMLDHQNY